MTPTGETESVTITVTLHGGHREQLRGVDARDADHERVRFGDWAALGGVQATRDEWPGSQVLVLISEATGVTITVPFAAIAILAVTPEREG